MRYFRASFLSGFRQSDLSKQLQLLRDQTTQSKQAEAELQERLDQSKSELEKITKELNRTNVGHIVGPLALLVG